MQKKLVLIFLSLLLLAGCAKKEPSDFPKEPSRRIEEVFFTDALGSEQTIAKNPKCVVSLLGSFGEAWMDAGGKLSGITEDAVSERKLDIPENCEIIGSVKEPNIEKILSLSPDFVILSADIESHLKAAETLKASSIPFAFFRTEYFDDYLSMLKTMTDLTGREDRYIQNGLNVQEKIDAILAEVKDKERPTVLFIRAFSSGSKAKGDDNMTGAMLKDLGCDNIVSRHKSLLEDLSLEEVIVEDPDFIFVTTMGNEQKALEAFQESIMSNPAWKDLSAVKNGHFHVLPKELFHYKPNARWSESYEYLKNILYSK